MISKAYLSHKWIIATAFLGIVSAITPRAHATEGDTEALVRELDKTKLTLLDGVRQASKDSAVPISAKFELEDGKLSLSVYTAGKGLSVPAEENVLQEMSGSPDGGKWDPKVEVFKDVAHVSRSAEQLAIMALGRHSLADTVAAVQKSQPGRVFSITPMVKDHKPMAEVLVTNKGKVTRLWRPL